MAKPMIRSVDQVRIVSGSGSEYESGCESRPGFRSGFGFSSRSGSRYNRLDLGLDAYLGLDLVVDGSGLWYVMMIGFGRCAASESFVKVVSRDLRRIAAGNASL